MSKLILSSITITAILALSACGSNQAIPNSANAGDPLAQARAYESEGNNQKAADMYWLASGKMTGIAKENFRVKAAEVALLADNRLQTRSIIRKIPQDQLSPTMFARLQIVNSKLALRRGDIETANAELNKVDQSQITGAVLDEVQKLSAQLNSDNPLVAGDSDSLQQMIQQHASSRAPDLKESIWNSLRQMPQQTITKEIGGTKDKLYKGWLELAYVEKTSTGNDQKRALEFWKRRYKNHPALNDDSSISYGEGAFAGGSILEGEIAILLPTSGNMTTVADIVSAGIETAYRDYDGNANISLQRYDSGNSVEDIVQAYNSAIANGAKVVIGPLLKEQVDFLQRQALSVPVISLNYAAQPQLNSNMLEFGLSPEDEARQVARRMIADGRLSIVTLTPESDWGDRVLNAFTDEVNISGGQVIDAGRYDTEKNDNSPTIKQVLKVNKSRASRRRDVDAIFVAATPKRARLIKPLLRFHFAESLPVYATSHVYTGKPNSNQDRDLNGIYFVDTPWTLGIDNVDDDNISVDDGGLDQRSPRLFALGMDSFRLATRTDTLSDETKGYIQGYTGNLSLDAESNHIIRELRWAKFSSGKADVQGR